MISRSDSGLFLRSTWTTCGEWNPPIEWASDADEAAFWVVMSWQPLIWCGFIPFTDRQTSKRRPALVLSTVSYQNDSSTCISHGH